VTVVAGAVVVTVVAGAVVVAVVVAVDVTVVVVPVQPARVITNTTTNSPRKSGFMYLIACFIMYLLTNIDSRQTKIPRNY
jgi:hypothetical protein